MKYLTYIFIVIIAFSLKNAQADYAPPLAPPSSLTLSLDEMILHFKIFIIADIFKKITGSGSAEEQKYFTLTDIELAALFSKEINKQTFLNKTEKLEFFFLHKELYVHLEDQYCRYYTLEVLPGEFEFKIFSLTEDQYSKLLIQQKIGNT